MSVNYPPISEVDFDRESEQTISDSQSQRSRTAAVKNRKRKEQDEVDEEQKNQLLPPQREIDVASSFGGSINDRAEYTSRMQDDQHDPPTVKELQKAQQPQSMRNVFTHGQDGKEQMAPTSSFKKGRDSCMPT